MTPKTYGCIFYLCSGGFSIRSVGYVLLYRAIEKNRLLAHYADLQFSKAWKTNVFKISSHGN